MANIYWFWVDIDFISTPEISVVVIIDCLRPRPIPTDTYSESLSILSLAPKHWSWSLSTGYDPGHADSNKNGIWVDIDHNQVYHYKLITTQIDYDQESFWVATDYTTTTDYNPVYNSRPITTQIDYNLQKFWVIIELITTINW